MEEHNVDIIEIEEIKTYKNLEVKFFAIYEYCSVMDKYLETEDMARINKLAIKDSYQKKISKLKEK